MSKQLIIGLIFGILLTSGTAIAQKGKIRKAQNFIEALDYQAAVDILLPLAENNDNAEIATMLGHIFRKQNSYGKAAVWYEKAVALEGVEAAAYFYYGMMLLHTDKCREAQDQFDYFLSLNPLDPRQFQLRDACTHRQSLLKKDENTLEVEVLAINSVLSDIGPAFYKNGLVFGSVRAPQNGGSQDKADPFYDLYYAEMVDGHFDFTDPQSFSDRINSRVHEAIVTFSSDATKIYFTRNQGTDNEHSSATATGLEIVYAVSEDGNRWSDLQLLPFNSPKYSIAHPSLSPDGSMLFFSSNMPGGFGGKDIYVSKWEEHYWGDPVNLGPLVNTEGDEMFPFYHSSGKLFFSSDGQVGLGGQDIFSTSPNKAGVWDNILNIGAPINTEFDDYGIIVSPDEEYGYFTSNRPGGIGKDDIYGFQKPQEEEELVTQQDIPEGNKVVVHVQVIDASNGKRIENPVITNCEANLYRSVGTSSFQMNLFPGDCCEVSVSAPGFQETTIEICGDPSKKSRAVALKKTSIPTAPPQEEVITQAPTPTPVSPEEKVEEAVAETPKAVEPEPQPEEKVEETIAEAPKEVEPEPQPEEKVEETIAETPKAVEPEPQPEEKVEETIAETPKAVEPEPQPEEKVEETIAETPKAVEPEPQPEEKVEETIAETPKAVEPEPQPEEELEEAVVVASKKVEPKPQPEEKVEEKVVEAPKKIEPAPQPKEPAGETVAKTPDKVAPEPKPEEDVKESSENAITVANEAQPEPSSAPGVVEETTEIVRQTTRARKTTKYLIGTVYDPLNSRPIPYATIHMLNSTCGVNIRITSDASGHYRLPLVANCCINIRVEKEGFQTYTALEALCTDKNGNIKGSTSILLKPEEPKPEPTVANSESNMLVNPDAFKGFERSKNKRLGDKSLAFILNVYYESARTSVKAESVEELKKLLRLLEENPTLIVEIGAHTDSRGSGTYNQDLSQRRAENVVKYLVSQGINEKRLIPKGYGETQLINDCDDSKECGESEHQINRRTEFRVIGGLDKTE